MAHPGTSMIDSLRDFVRWVVTCPSGHVIPNRIILPMMSNHAQVVLELTFSFFKLFLLSHFRDVRDVRDVQYGAPDHVLLSL